MMTLDHRRHISKRKRMPKFFQSPASFASVAERFQMQRKQYVSAAAEHEHCHAAIPFEEPSVDNSTATSWPPNHERQPETIQNPYWGSNAS